MEKIYFITIENSEIGKVKVSQYGFTDEEMAKDALNEVVEDYMVDIKEKYEDDLYEEKSDFSYYATDDCGLYIYIEVQSVEVVNKKK